MMDGSYFLMLLLVLFAVFMFWNARRQRRQYQELQQMQSSLAPGDRVMTTSGLYGTIVGTADDTIDIEVAPGVHTKWVRQAVREKVKTDTGGDIDDDDAADELADDVVEERSKTDGR
jgi:preprotein translocase subunit YajC